MAKVTPGSGSKKSDSKKGDKTEKTKRVRLPFRADNAPKLTAAPAVAKYVNGAYAVEAGKEKSTFHPRNHKMLKKSDFENAADYVDFQASLLDIKSAIFAHQATDRRAKASQMRTAGPAAKKANKLSRVMAEQADLLATLTAELGEEAVKQIQERALAKSKELLAKKQEKAAAAA
jgi:hypothetical protein